MRKFFIAVIMLMASLIVVPASAVQAESPVPVANSAWGFGVFRNGSDHGLWAVKNWKWCINGNCDPDAYSGIYGLGAGAEIFWVNPGELTSKYWGDTDGFFIGQGYCTLIQVAQTGYRVPPWRDLMRWRGPATVKLPDYPMHQLQEYRC